MCQICSLLFMRPPTTPHPHPHPHLLCSRDAGGVSLLKMLIHHLLDLRPSACIKGLHLDGEAASARRACLRATPGPSDRPAKSCVAPLPLPGIPIAIGQTPPPPHQNQVEGEKSPVLLCIDPIYMQESDSINHNRQPDSKQITVVPQMLLFLNGRVNTRMED